jgi:hypothetical protein
VPKASQVVTPGSGKSKLRLEIFSPVENEELKSLKKKRRIGGGDVSLSVPERHRLEKLKTLKLANGVGDVALRVSERHRLQGL